jgi:hypothetical protein
MPDQLYTLQVALSNGETRELDGGTTEPDAIVRLHQLESGTGEFSTGWCETTETTMIATAHIVEANIVPIP